MRAVIFRLTGVIALMLAASGVVAWLFGALPAALVACAVALGVIGSDTAAQLRLLAWLKSPESARIPPARGVWAEVFYRAARQLRLWETRVHGEEDKLRRFIEALQASPNGLILMDGADQIDWCNDTAAAHFGLDARRDLRQHAVHLIRNPEFFAYMAAKRFDTPLLMRRTTNHGSLLLSVQVIPYGDGQKLMLSRDVTQVERTEAMRRDFVANVSHEIKTPLTVIAGFIESLRGLDFSAEERDRILALMQEQSDRMRHLVEDLLTLAHLEGDPHQPAEEVLDMRQMVERLGADARALSGGHHDIELSADVGNVRGARTELTSAFTNLVSNAVRYTPPGGTVRIAWRVRQIDAGGPVAEFSVSDSGIGIAQEHIPRLTERFYRVDRGRSRESGGTGLGLAIVKHVLLRHQAELRISSQPGQGSVFTVRFPVQRLVMPAGPEAPEATAVDRESISA
ncbi:phosphate regulon sensor histidine kinase PhoR [Thiomonas sp. FB-Cd]|uniref:phosphate regulon sensor histidine kinase PhoR n=1 Tax=Thiomonas sp. FB-Cd TaxID=1158292 RepID=UPI000571BC16|nr:phosphate regulon sensor histidine kinase PhoR [Thiomonas sp. FB-Cd]